MVTGLALAIAGYLMLVAIGSFPAGISMRGEGRLRTLAIAPLLGLAIATAWMDLLGYFLATRVVAWTIPPLALVSLSLAVTRWRRTSRARPATTHGLGVFFDVASLAVPTMIALLVGAVPLFVAGRLTVSALTNDDASYYMSAAEQLQAYPWRTRLESPEFCLSERLIHAWYWRVGVPQLVAVTSTLARVSVPAALGVVTTFLYALVPAGAIVFTQMLVIRMSRLSRAVVGSLVAITAAPIFLGYQQFLGQLAASVMFPVACASLALATARGGLRRILLAGLLVGAGLAVFADGGIVLVLGGLAALVSTRGPWRTRIRRLAAIAGVAALAFLPTVVRAGYALWGTIRFRVAASKPMFPQTGWLSRSPLDDLATLAGTDPWPPWPAPFPPTVVTVVAWLGAIAVVPLVVWGLREVRAPRVAYVLSAFFVLALLAAQLGGTRYLVSKVLLMGASFVVPIAALAFTRALPRRRWALFAGSLWAISAGVATASLMRPDGFHVIDGPEHDQLVKELSALPPGSLIALDGFGALADDAHDEHRAYRAALLARLRPIQPGPDGGFYRTWCRDPEAYLPLPPRAWALQRMLAETISRGRAIASFGPFVLREVDLGAIDGVAGSYAPTSGWLGVERATDHTVFRWAGREARATLRLVQPAPCAALTGETRTVGGAGALTLFASDSAIVTTSIVPIWTAFRTGPFDAAREQPLVFRALLSSEGHDDRHAFALRRIAVVVEPTCVLETRRVARIDHDPPLPEPLDDSLAYTVTPAAGVTCGQVVAVVSATGSEKLALDVGGDAVGRGAFTDATPTSTTLTSNKMTMHGPILVTVRRQKTEAASTSTPSVTSLRVIPCASP